MEGFDLYISDTFIIITYFIQGKLMQYKITV